MARRKRTEYFYNPIETENDIAIGIKLPFNSTVKGISSSNIASSGSLEPIYSHRQGLFELSYSTEDQAISNLKCLILTRKGERYMQPLFGTDIYDFLFENKTEHTVQKLKTSLIEDINYWLPYIVIESLIVNTDYNDNYLKMSLHYKVTQQGSEETITIFVDESGVTVE